MSYWYDSISAFDVNEWDSLNPSNLFLTATWLKLVEGQPGRGSVPRRYFGYRDEAGRLLGALPTYRFDEPPSWLYDPSQCLEGQRNQVQAWRPIVIAGGCADFRGEFVLAADLDPVKSALVADQLMASARAWAAESGAALCVMYLSEADLRRCGVSLADDRTRSLDVEYTIWTRGGYDQAVRSLSGKNRREMGREQRVFEQAGGRMSVCPLSDAPVERMAELRANLMRKHGHKYEVETALFELTRQREHFGEFAQVMLASDRDDEIIGFAVHIAYRDEWYVRSGGFDYSSRVPYAYPHVTIYGPLRAAAEFDVSAIRLGLSAAAAKTARGATGLQLYGLFEPSAGCSRR